MSSILGFLTAAVIPILIVLTAVVFLLAVKYFVSRYKKIPPGKVGIFYGKKYKDSKGETKGFMIMSGGGRFLRPVVEDFIEIPTTAFQVEINESGIPNKDNVKLTVPGVATCKISTIPENLQRAVEALVDKLTQENGPKRGSTDSNPIEEFVRNILKGHLRSIIGKLDINELLRNRDEFNKRVVEESAAELASFGIELMNLVIQDIIDAEGYIDALGKRAVADAKAEAETKTAEAKRNQDISVSNAQREAAVVQANNDAQIADANKTRDLKKAGFLKETASAQAEANMAGQIATTAQEQKLRVAEAERDAAEREAQVKVQRVELTRKNAELEATVIATANADASKSVIQAEAARKTKVIEAEATAKVAETTAEAQKKAAIAKGEGEAAAKQANLFATANGEAQAKRAALMAEAEGTSALAKALGEMSTDARFIIILDKLPKLMESGGEAGAKVLAAMFGPIAAGIGSIDSVRIVDMGNGTGSAGINKMSGAVTDTVINTIKQLKASGVDLDGLAKMVGVDLSGFNTLLDGVSPSSEGTGVASKGSTAHS
jgi:flotillin